MNAPGASNEIFFLGDDGKLVSQSPLQQAWEPERCQALIDQLWALREEMLTAEAQREQTLALVSDEYRASARNLVHYLVLRQQDRRAIQEELARLGLSSLGRSEAHVLANLDKVIGALHALSGQQWQERSAEEPVGLQESQRLLRQHSTMLLGPGQPGRAVRIMVTLPSEAAKDYGLVHSLVESGMNLARINCAHDNAEAWGAMAANVRRAATEQGVPVRILMDLGGPKLRTGHLPAAPAVLKIKPVRDLYGRVIHNARLRLYPEGEPLNEQEAQETGPVLAVNPNWLAALETGESIRLVDARGKQRCLRVVERDEAGVFVESEQTVYLVPHTCLERAGECHETRVTDISGLPERAGSLMLKAGDFLRVTRPDSDAYAEDNDSIQSISCTLPEVFTQVHFGERIYFDDGKIGGVIREASEEGLLVEIVRTGPNGSRLIGDKGINLPDSQLVLPALTARDIEDLYAVAQHADLVGLSFVQDTSDVTGLHELLDGLDAQNIGMVLKIETRRAFENLPELMLAAMSSRCAGVMIARGDLAVECGYERLAEVQEEILWAAEAAHMPVIWATQVLEKLAKTGQPSRAEITDAAMGERAECVMLNKGPHIHEAVRVLDDILRRMNSHQDKKRSLLRALASWSLTR